MNKFSLSSNSPGRSMINVINVLNAATHVECISRVWSFGLRCSWLSMKLHKRLRTCFQVAFAKEKKIIEFELKSIVVRTSHPIDKADRWPLRLLCRVQPKIIEYRWCLYHRSEEQRGSNIRTPNLKISLRKKKEFVWQTCRLFLIFIGRFMIAFVGYSQWTRQSNCSWTIEKRIPKSINIILRLIEPNKYWALLVSISVCKAIERSGKIRARYSANVL